LGSRGGYRSGRCWRRGFQELCGYWILIVYVEEKPFSWVLFGRNYFRMRHYTGDRFVEEQFFITVYPGVNMLEASKYLEKILEWDP
jgi:hypothetical protein